MDPTATSSNRALSVSDIAAVTAIYAATPCFVTGTRIATTRGEVAVEDLRPGEDMILTATGSAPRPLRWLGYRGLTPATSNDAASDLPYRVRAEALAPSTPKRDLLLSPDHSLLIDGVLIPVRLLDNGVSISRENAADWPAITYWHIELDAHDAILAEGAPAESYLDTGNRTGFDNAPGSVIPLHATRLELAEAAYADKACAPACWSGPKLAAAWSRIAARAMALPQQTNATSLTDQHDAALTDGTTSQLLSESPDLLSVDPLTIAAPRLRSRAAAPAEVDASSSDHRQLGVCISHIVLRYGTQEFTIPAGAVIFDTLGGWYPAERDEAGHCWRWTNGDAALPMLFSGTPDALRIGIAGRMRYPVSATPASPEAGTPAETSAAA